MNLQRISADWNCPVIVAATGPSLTADVAQKVRAARWPAKRARVVVVNDAWRLLPYADVLYACDLKWWKLHAAAVAAGFHGERWSTHEKIANDKSEMPIDVNLVAGTAGDTFSDSPDLIHYGSNSGFQAVNFALLKGATRIVLVGFDMRVVDGRRHFFGDHPQPLSNHCHYELFLRPFRTAAKSCRVPIVNATPGSAIDCWPRVDLEEALGAADAARPDDRVYRDGTERHAAAGAGRPG